MKIPEIIKLFATISALFPRDSIFASAPEEVTIAWHVMLKDIPYEVAQIAVQAHATRSPFPPSIAEIRGFAVQNEGMNEMEAWGLVRKAIKRSAYHAKEEFDKLPEDIQKLLGGPSQLRDWGQMEADTMSVTQSNFMRAYRAKVKTNADLAALPASMQEIMGRVGEGQKRLEG